MARTQTMVQLSDDLLDALDAVAAQASRSRSAVIRDAIEAYLAQKGNDPIGRAIAEGYQRIPQGGDGDAADLAAWADARTKEILTAMDGEDGGFPDGRA